MRITKLYIKSYKNLQDFTWELNPDYPVAVIVGKNASGKSNLLEAILTIFAQVRTDKVDKKFYFEIAYQDIDRNEIVFKNDEKGFSSTRNGASIDANRVFPKQIVSYYAGISVRMNRLISEYRKKKENTQDFDIIYAQEIHFRFALLALFGSNLDRIKVELLSNTFDIEEFISFQIKIQKPTYNLSKEANIENFWFAPTNLSIFFQVLIENSNHGRTDINEYVLTFNSEDLKKLMSSSIINNNEATFFEYLSEAFTNDYIRNIGFRFKKKGIDEILSFDDLSEGEKQRIGMRGTIELFLGNETLFLLDEPDAFAHPRWQWQFVPDLQETLGDSRSSQVIFVTHSPLVLSTVRDNAFMMEGGQIREIYGTYGQDAGMSLLKMDSEDRLKEVQDRVDLYAALVQDGNMQTDRAKEMKAKLIDELGINHPIFIELEPLEKLYE